MRLILRKFDERYSEIVREWEGETVVIVGGGSSLTFPDIDLTIAARKAGRIKCIAVNSAYLTVPCADVCYFSDSHFWADHFRGVPIPLLSLTAEQTRERFASFQGQKCSIKNSGGNITDPAVHIVQNRHGQGSGFGLSLDPRYLVDGRNSGFTALNAGILAGVKRALLLGFDGNPGPDGRTHLIPNTRPTPMDAYPLYRKAMEQAKEAITKLGVEVVNCSLQSAIETWPKKRLVDLL